MTDRPLAKRRFAARLRLARAALVWERAWPALWPALFVLGVFAVAALFDVLPLLPGEAHAGVLALFALAAAGALLWGWRSAGLRAWPDTVAARRRIEQTSGLPHRPLEALADRPSAPLDGAASVLWAAHQRRMAAAVRRLRVGWPAAGLARRDPWGVRAVLAMLMLLGAIDAGADWRDRVARAFLPNFASGAPTIAASFDLWLTPPEYTGLAPQFLRAGDSETVRVPTGSVLLAQVHGGNAVPSLAIDAESRDFAAIDKHNFRIEATLTAGAALTLNQGERRASGQGGFDTEIMLVDCGEIARFRIDRQARHGIAAMHLGEQHAAGRNPHRLAIAGPQELRRQPGVFGRRQPQIKAGRDRWRPAGKVRQKRPRHPVAPIGTGIDRAEQQQHRQHRAHPPRVAPGQASRRPADAQPAHCRRHTALMRRPQNAGRAIERRAR